MSKIRCGVVPGRCGNEPVQGVLSVRKFHRSHAVALTAHKLDKLLNIGLSVDSRIPSCYGSMIGRQIELERMYSGAEGLKALHLIYQERQALL